jgi:hypothetical protein
MVTLGSQTDIVPVEAPVTGEVPQSVVTVNVNDPERLALNLIWITVALSKVIAATPAVLLFIFIILPEALKLVP